MSINYRQSHTPPIPIPTPFIPAQLNKRLGSGLLVPFNLEDNRSWTVIDGVDKVEQSIIVCLTTPVNRRLGQADYGSELPYMIHEEYTTTLQRELIHATQGALTKWVPQIIIGAVTVDILPSNVVAIVIQYMITGTSVFNIVTLALTSDDSVQIPPGAFRINGRRLIAGIP